MLHRILYLLVGSLNFNVEEYPKMTISGHPTTVVTKEMQEVKNRESKFKTASQASKNYLFHRDNVSVHGSVVAVAATPNAGFEILEHPTYSPHHAPSDFYLFLKLKKYLKR
ncbi:hypothetical protein EVAR_93907_1 [Eumeta japonica]|uniref:Histone-lysine N-methyltransferase SETMAR n=1 Tax=Eumeta variegata TaxID=151549 RepID=A0A4C1TP20_EUMVA|nr:hypothetical protein EVAR_93907_1 [Eumeta japonica]